MSVQSGLRNPERSARSVGAAALAAEGLVLLLAIAPMKVLHVEPLGLAIGVIVALVVVCFGLAGLLRHAWAWLAGIGVQVALVAAGIALHPSLAVVGVIFGGVWAYVLSVRRTITRRS